MCRAPCAYRRMVVGYATNPDVLSGRGRVPDRPCRDGPGLSGGMTLARKAKRGLRTALWHRARRSPPIRGPRLRWTRAPRMAFRNSPVWAVAIGGSIITKIPVTSGLGKADAAIGTGMVTAPAGGGVVRPRIRVDDCGAIAETRFRPIAARPLRPQSGGGHILRQGPGNSR